ncbi:hypothetical protein AB1Y20_002876 [Prymnesium parvum]|uniref:SGNH hydrolase-type esterase domain-containing protein n=1 Tax=Prymnesium parvum TaxID=97485 RepID=A0AB34JC62_PRYPA
MLALRHRAEHLEQRLQLAEANCTLRSPRRDAFARVLARLLRGQPVRVAVVGGSAAAGAGGCGYNATFDALLVLRLNALLAEAERATAKPLGRLVRMNAAQGGTSSLWAAALAEALPSRRAHLLLWEYAINDHAVALEAAARGGAPEPAASLRFMLEVWLRRALSSRPPPALLLAYLWDKQACLPLLCLALLPLPPAAARLPPAAAFKPGNRALCRRRPVPSSAFDAQREVLARYAPHSGGFAALNAAGYASRAGGAGLCPLIADSYFHPSAAGHLLLSELLEALLLRALLPPPAAPPPAAAADAPLPACGWPLPRAPAAAADGVSAALAALLAAPSPPPHALLAWQPQASSWAGAPPPPALRLRGAPPAARLFAKAERTRADRKWMWLVPACGRNASLQLELPAAAAALSYFAMASPGAAVRHSLDGAPIEFRTARGSVLERSWGYLASWHLLDGAAAGGAAGGSRVWSLCAETVPNARCIGWRCGLEFKMPMRTAAVGWFIALVA